MHIPLLSQFYLIFHCLWEVGSWRRREINPKSGSYPWPCLDLNLDSIPFSMALLAVVPVPPLSPNFGPRQFSDSLPYGHSYSNWSGKGWWNILHCKPLITSNVWNMGQFLGNIQNTSGSINISVERKTQISYGDFKVL